MATTEPVIFNTVVEGARKAYGKRLTPDLLAKLSAVGMDFENPLPAYPMETFLTAIGVLAEAVAPGQPSELQHLQLGREFMHGYVQTALGLATLTMGRVIGVKRTLLRFGRALKTTGNYVDAEATELGPAEVEIVTRIVPAFRSLITARWRAIAHYRVGVIEGALEILNVDGTVQLTDGEGPHESRFRVAWKQGAR